jgi:hypothetical protein
MRQPVSEVGYGGWTRLTLLSTVRFEFMSRIIMADLEHLVTIMENQDRGYSRRNESPSRKD